MEWLTILLAPILTFVAGLVRDWLERRQAARTLEELGWTRARLEGAEAAARRAEEIDDAEDRARDLPPGDLRRELREQRDRLRAGG